LPWPHAGHGLVDAIKVSLYAKPLRKRGSDAKLLRKRASKIRDKIKAKRASRCREPQGNA